MAVWIHQRGSCYHLKTLLTDDTPDSSCVAAMRGDDQTENACCVKSQLMNPQNASVQVVGYLFLAPFLPMVMT